MRQPLEDAKVTISRASGSVTYPAQFQLVCAMNPCKCGWYGNPDHPCTCSYPAVQAYRSRISGPLLDRIDIIIEVPALKFDELRHRREAETSAAIKARVNEARRIQRARYAQGNTVCNAQMGPNEMRKYCMLDAQTEKLMKDAFETYGLTARSYDRILRVARTIADLEGSECIQMHHAAEAIQYRHVKMGNQ